MMFASRNDLLALLKGCIVRRKYSKSEQEKLCRLFPEERWYMNHKTFVRIDLDELVEIIRYLEGDDV